MDKRNKVNKGIGSDQIQHTNPKDTRRRAPHIINTSDNNVHIDSEGAMRSSSEQSEFDRLAWNAYVKLCDIARTKISVFGDDPIKEKIETELADISLKKFGRQMEPIVPDYNKYLEKIRGDIYHVKEGIREIKRRDKEEGERLFQMIKPSIMQILDANQVINYAFHDQASKRDTDTDYIKSLFIPLGNRCEELKKAWQGLNEPSQGVLQTDSRKNNLGAFEKYKICERDRRETKKFISQLENIPEDTILSYISRLGTAKTTISNIRRNVVQIVEVGFPLDEAISNMQTIVEFSNRFKDEAGLPSRDPQSFQESCDKLNTFWNTVRQTIPEIDPEDQGKA